MTSTRRDAFLDTVRAVAVARVVTWHTYGWAPITWFVAAVPAMFFVSGHLLARSVERRDARTVVLDRLRRLLVPFWAFGLAAWVVMAAARVLEGTPETALPWRHLLPWVVPFDDPRGSVWEAGWLSQPLWYVRCWFWLLVLAPVLLRAARRAPRLLVAGLVAVTVGLEVAYRNVTWHDAAVPRLLWRTGDVALYAVFLVAGFLHAWSPAPRRRTTAALAAASVPLALAVVAVAPPEDHVVNNSHVLHLVAGAGWLAVALTLRTAITAVAERPVVARVVRGIGRRSLSIYLWHSAAVITTWQLLARSGTLPRGAHTVLLGLGTLAGTALLVRVAGPVEDLAARRVRASGTVRRRARPVATVRLVRAAPTLAGLVLFALAAGVLLPATAADDRPVLDAVAVPATEGARVERTAATDGGTATRAPRVPSRAPTVPLAARAELAASAGSSAGTSGAAALAEVSPTGEDESVADPSGAPRTGVAALQTVVNRWQDQYASSGLRAGVARPGFTWIGAPYDGMGSGSFDIESITKTVTASAAWLLARDGTLRIDGPVPEVPGLPELAGRGLTVRHLLEHRSGIPEYHFLDIPEETDEDPALVVVRAALAADAAFGPGEGQDYSSTNTLLLGLVLEAVTGRSLDDVLWSTVLEPAGVGSSFGRVASSTAAPGGGAGGLSTDVAGLLAWGTALLRDHQPVGDAVFASMTGFSPDTGLGAGLLGMCPCEGGFRWVGHTGGTTAVFYDRSTDVVVALRIANGIWGDFEGPFAELVESLRDAARDG